MPAWVKVTVELAREYGELVEHPRSFALVGLDEEDAVAINDALVDLIPRWLNQLEAARKEKSS